MGELRDLETIGLAITAAEMGNLVFATLHTNSAAKTIDRIIDVFPEEQQNQIRTMLSVSLKGIIAQLLMEALVLASLGGIAGLVLARGGVALLVRIAPSNLPRLDEVHLDGTVLMFTMGTVLSRASASVSNS